MASASQSSKFVLYALLRYESAQMGEMHINQILKCLPFCWKTIKTNIIYVYSFIHGPCSGLERSVLFEPDKAVPTGSGHLELSQSIVELRTRSYQLNLGAHSICSYNRIESAGHRLNRKVNHLTNQRERMGTDSYSLVLNAHTWERMKQCRICSAVRTAMANQIGAFDKAKCFVTVFKSVWRNCNPFENRKETSQSLNKQKKKRNG